MQQAIQTQAIGIEGIWGEFTRQLPELLFNIVRHTDIKDALHQGFDGKKVSIDIFQISHRLMDGISRLFSTTNWGGMGLSISARSAMLLLQILEHTAGEGSEGLKGRPTQLLLLTQGW